MEDKVVLDERSFKALSADSRVNILKRLTERRMTLSELSHRLALKNSTIKEHCTILLNANLIKKIDEGRKWKYYELTGKGKQIVQPSFMEGIRVLITLCFGAIIFGGILLFAMQGAFLTTGSDFAPQQMLKTNIISDSAMTTSIESMPAMGGEATDNVVREIGSNTNIYNITVNYNLFSTAIITVLVLGIFIGWIVGRKIN
ncbi:MAG: winged helix-turn-helix transcriptional regulator [Candidatus Diapherotrites archaeon]|jgi:DNA-binding transcriptional ArsR family regulator|nr:winged helix-turn-helix transcriptional regulator [Candidatus Diapherotrites archaeon]MBT4596775.1 winged helix-turn-helix transcriptional regulator [Candidatus Diapherotrites archaeon]